jgi:hypothetical protein
MDPKELDRRLPRKAFLTTGDVASVVDVSRQLIGRWIEEGRFGERVFNVSSGMQPRWRIERSAVLDLFRRDSRAVVQQRRTR